VTAAGSPLPMALPGLVASDEPCPAAEDHLNSPFKIFNYTPGTGRLRRPIRFDSRARLWQRSFFRSYNNMHKV